MSEVNQQPKVSKISGRPWWRLSWPEVIVVVGMISLLISILLPKLNEWRQRQMGGRVPCASNLNQIGLSLHVYAMDHGGQFPDTLEPIFTAEDLAGPECFVCPSTGDKPRRGRTLEEKRSEFHSGKHMSYVYVGAGLKYELSSQLVVAFDRLSNHGEGSYVLFADGHVDWVPAGAMQRILDEVAAGRLPVSLPIPTAHPSTRPSE